jgi:hypothetical protein
MPHRWQPTRVGDALGTGLGVTDSDAEHLVAAFNIKTVRDPGSNKYFAVAGVLVALAGHTG